MFDFPQEGAAFFFLAQAMGLFLASRGTRTLQVLSRGLLEQAEPGESSKEPKWVLGEGTPSLEVLEVDILWPRWVPPLLARVCSDERRLQTSPPLLRCEGRPRKNWTK